MIFLLKTFVSYTFRFCLLLSRVSEKEWEKKVELFQSREREWKISINFIVDLINIIK